VKGVSIRRVDGYSNFAYLSQMKMRTLLCFLMLFSAEIHLIAQVNPEREIAGIWKVKKVRKDLLGSTFQFSPDHYATFSCAKQKKLSFQAANWIALGDPDKIIVQNWPVEGKPAAEIMKISVMKKDGKTVFVVNDLFELEMERVIVKKERH